MGRKPHTPRVGQALGIAHQHVHVGLDRLQRGQQAWNLPKGQEARDVGKPATAALRYASRSIRGPGKSRRQPLQARSTLSGKPTSAPAIVRTLLPSQTGRTRWASRSWMALASRGVTSQGCRVRCFKPLPQSVAEGQNLFPLRFARKVLSLSLRASMPSSVILSRMRSISPRGSAAVRFTPPPGILGPLGLAP